MSSEKAEEEVATQSPEKPIEEGATHSSVMPPPPREPEMETHSQCQTWLVDLLDDVRYLISCTNWY